MNNNQNNKTPSVVVVGRRKEPPEKLVKGHFRNGKYISSHKRTNFSNPYKIIGDVEKRRETLLERLGIKET